VLVGQGVRGVTQGEGGSPTCRHAPCSTHYLHYHHHCSPGDPFAHEGECEPLQPPRAHRPAEMSVVPAEAACDRGARSMQGRGRDRSLRGHTGREQRGWEHTENICHVFVTRAVSQLSGWLKAVAPCRGSHKQGVNGAGRAAGRAAAGRREAVCDCGACSMQWKTWRDCADCGQGARSCAHRT